MHNLYLKQTWRGQARKYICLRVNKTYSSAKENGVYIHKYKYIYVYLHM